MRINLSGPELVAAGGWWWPAEWRRQCLLVIGEAPRRRMDLTPSASFGFIAVRPIYVGIQRSLSVHLPS